MRTLLLSSIAAVGLLAAPAFAQSSDQGGQKQGQPAASSQQTARIHAMSQERLRKSLEQAGFKNVTVLDATYLVQAQSPHGERVTMLIDPPMVATTGSGGASAGGTGDPQQQQNQGGGSSTQQ